VPEERQQEARQMSLLQSKSLTKRHLSGLSVRTKMARLVSAASVTPSCLVQSMDSSKTVNQQDILARAAITPLLCPKAAMSSFAVHIFMANLVYPQMVSST